MYPTPLCALIYLILKMSKFAYLSTCYFLFQKLIYWIQKGVSYSPNIINSGDITSDSTFGNLFSETYY